MEQSVAVDRVGLVALAADRCGPLPATRTRRPRGTRWTPVARVRRAVIAGHLGPGGSLMILQCTGLELTLPYRSPSMINRSHSGSQNYIEPQVRGLVGCGAPGDRTQNPRIKSGLESVTGPAGLYQHVPFWPDAGAFAYRSHFAPSTLATSRRNERRSGATHVRFPPDWQHPGSTPARSARRLVGRVAGGGGRGYATTRKS